MIALLPNWLVAVSAMVGVAVFVTGRIRLAVMLAAPALLRFVVWPAVLPLLRGGTLLLLILVALLALPVIIVRTSRGLLVLFVGEAAADHAIGRAIGDGIVRLAGRRRLTR
jgi:hypothetical protein